MTTRRAEAIWIESRKRWQINVQRDGERKTFTSSTQGKKGKHEAEAKADKWLLTFQTDQRFGDAAQAFRDEKEKTLQATSFNVWSTYFDKWIMGAFPAGKKLAMISIYDWQTALDKLSGLREAYIKTVMRCMREFVNYCLNRQWAVTEIREGMLKIPDTTDKHIKTALTIEQVNALIAIPADEYKSANLFKFCVLTGCRKGEALSLMWSDISDNSISIKRNLAADGSIHSGKTVNAIRTIPMTDALRQLLSAQEERLLQKGINTPWAFPNENTGNCERYGALETHWNAIKTKIGANITIHELRHTFISLMKSELPDTLLKQIVGHSASMDTIGVYGHQTQEDITVSADIINKVFSEKTHT